MPMPNSTVQNLTNSVTADATKDTNDGWLAGNFSGPELYKTLVQSWWWPRIHSNALEYANNCPQCAMVQGAGGQQNPSLHPIFTEHPFQIVGSIHSGVTYHF